MLSISSNTLYAKAIIDLQEEDETKSINCPISLDTPAKNSKIFDWLFVPVGKGLSHAYDLRTIKKYCDDYKRENIPCPQRTLISLDHMIKRIDEQYKIVETTGNVIAKEITDVYRKNILQEILNKWSNGEKIDDFTKNRYLLINLQTFVDMNLLFDYYHENIKNIGSFFLRSSMLSTKENDGDFTIFSITYITVENKINSIRFLSLHGVGVYKLTGSNSTDIPIDVIKTGDIKKIIEHTRSAPTFACILHMIDYYCNSGIFNTKYFVRP